MKLTKKQLQEMVSGIVTNYMADMGDSKMAPEAHVFYYRGIPSRSLLVAITGIVEELEANGIPLANDKNTTVNQIIIDIRKAIKEKL